MPGPNGSKTNGNTGTNGTQAGCEGIHTPVELPPANRRERVQDDTPSVTQIEPSMQPPIPPVFRPKQVESANHTTDPGLK